METEYVLLVAGMAVVTAFTRLSGYWIVARTDPGPRVRRFLETAPQTVFAAMIAPALWQGGPAEWLGAGATVIAMKLSGNLAVALIAGVGTVAFIRMAGVFAGAGS